MCRTVEFIFTDDGQRVFSRFVPTENLQRAYKEYSVKAKSLGLGLFWICEVDWNFPPLVAPLAEAEVS